MSDEASLSKLKIDRLTVTVLEKINTYDDDLKEA